EDGIRDLIVTGVQTCALPICLPSRRVRAPPWSEAEEKSRTRSSARDLQTTRRTTRPYACWPLTRWRADRGSPPEATIGPERRWRSEERRVGKESRAGGRRGRW